MTKAEINMVRFVLFRDGIFSLLRQKEKDTPSTSARFEARNQTIKNIDSVLVHQYF